MIRNFSNSAYKSFIKACGLTLLLGACTSLEVGKVDVQAPQVQSQWQTAAVPDYVQDGWFSQYMHPQLQELVTVALTQNFDLLQAVERVEAARQQAIVAGAAQLPQAGLGLDANRSKSSNSVYSTQHSLGLDLSWEADIWGKLSDQARSAQLSYAATDADYQAARLSLVALVGKSWFDVQQSALLITQYQQRVENLRRNLEIIEAGYHSGIGDPLDVYLARSDVASEQARLTEEQQSHGAYIRTLQLLLGQYPSGKMDTELFFPLVDDEVAAGIPADVITRRYDVQAAWLNLQAVNADLAVAQKNQLPALQITGSLGKSSDDLSDLLNSGSLAWSIAGSLTQTLFDGGRLDALEAQAWAQAREAEQVYLQQVFTALEEVEAALALEASLKTRFHLLEETRVNAEAAEELSFEEYRRGLVAYSAVLDAQNRAFESQSAVISVQAQLLKNRINLHLALGGDFAREEDVSTHG